MSIEHTLKENDYTTTVRERTYTDPEGEPFLEVQCKFEKEQIGDLELDPVKARFLHRVIESWLKEVERAGQH